MNTRHWKELLALCMIGDGIVSLLMPSQHYKLWSSGSNWQCEIIEKVGANPGLVRAIGAAELCAGLWLARQQLEE